MDYSKASEEIVGFVQDIATRFHPRLGGCNVAVLMQEKATKSAGKTVLGTASLPPARMKPLLEDDVDFVLCLAADQWGTLDEAQRSALVDHELCHCAVDDVDGTPSIRGHDYEEFGAVIERHGYWRRDDGEKLVQQAFGGLTEDRPVRVSTIG